MITERILVVDDEPSMRKVLSRLLERAGYSVETAENGEHALDRLQDGGIDLVITDIRMPVMDGMELLGAMAPNLPDIPVIVITAHGTVDTAVTAMKLGAFDFVSKPFESDQLLRNCKKALAQSRAERRSVQTSRASSGVRLLGTSSESEALRQWIDKVAQLPSATLLTGEPGTGHGLVARAIHESSPRQQAPFVKITCGAIPRDWFESELFGHEAGAVPGSTSERPGRLELADGGTLFLNEIDAMPMDVQGQLLNVIKAGKVSRLGAFGDRAVDVRLIAGTHINLEEAVNEGRFRDDLFYALNVANFELTALRSRLEDLPDLAEYFVAKFNTRLGRQVTGISPEAMSMLLAHRWPGNVRELENVIERAMLFADGEILDVGHLPGQIQGGNEPDLPITDFDSNMKSIVRRATANIERQLIKGALDESQNNVTHAAKALGISRKSLQTKMKELGLREDS